MISLIVARSREGGIGLGNTIPWHLPEDLKHFRNVTTGHSVIMGRNTWESLGCKPLPRRTNIVISSSLDEAEGAILVKNVPEALVAARDVSGEVFVIGGASIYDQMTALCDRLIISEVDVSIDADRHFGDPDPGVWQIVSKDLHCEASIPFEVHTYERRLE